MPHADPVERAAYQKRYREAHRADRAAMRKYWDAAKHANDRARHYGCEGTLTTADILAILKPPGGALCHYCGTLPKARRYLTIDHVDPLHTGGANTPENVVASCLACNQSKWRGDRPWRWSRLHDRCVICGTSETPHCSLGRCRSCDSTIRTRERRHARDERKAVPSASH